MGLAWQRLEARVVRAEREAAAAHEALAEARLLAHTACNTKEEEVTARLAQLEEDPRHWPPHIRVKLDTWQHQVTNTSHQTVHSNHFAGGL